MGLGNFWRFPYIASKNGGGIFFLPYLLALFLLGIPMMLLELGLGQKFQRGDIGVFRGIHPKLTGVGISSIFSALVIAAYYSVIIAWALYYMVLSFLQPLPWSNSGMKEEEFGRLCTDISAAEEFFSRIALKYRLQDCETITPGETD